MNNLNLLPESIKNDIYLSKKNARIRQIFFQLIASFFMISAFFGVLFFFLFTQKADAMKQKETAQLQINRQGPAFDKALDLYQRMSLISKIDRTGIDWLKILNELASVTPANTQIESFTVMNQTGSNRIKITGNALSDKDVVAFKENIGKSTYFGYVDIESISKGSDTLGRNRELKTFTISFELKVKK